MSYFVFVLHQLVKQGNFKITSINLILNQIMPNICSFCFISLFLVHVYRCPIELGVKLGPETGCCHLAHSERNCSLKLPILSFPFRCPSRYPNNAECQTSEMRYVLLNQWFRGAYPKGALHFQNESKCFDLILSTYLWIRMYECLFVIVLCHSNSISVMSQW